MLKETDAYVVWLDDLERFLGDGGLTTSVLRRLLLPPDRTVVVATMRSHEYDRFRDRNEAEFIGADRAVWREGRAVLRQAQVVHLERRWTTQEQSRVLVHTSDHRFAQALEVADRFGIAETLAAGPELAEAWRHGWTPGHHPRGAALVAAAVGARNAGYHRALPLEVLNRMHSAYLAERGGTELHPEPIEEAVRWATTPTFPNGANSLLIGSTEQGYLAFDYLIDLPAVSRMPDSSWSILARDCHWARGIFSRGTFIAIRRLRPCLACLPPRSRSWVRTLRSSAGEYRRSVPTATRFAGARKTAPGNDHP